MMVMVMVMVTMLSLTTTAITGFINSSSIVVAITVDVVVAVNRTDHPPETGASTVSVCRCNRVGARGRDGIGRCGVAAFQQCLQHLLHLRHASFELVEVVPEDDDKAMTFCE